MFYPSRYNMSKLIQYLEGTRHNQRPFTFPTAFLIALCKRTVRSKQASTMRHQATSEIQKSNPTCMASRQLLRTKHTLPGIKQEVRALRSPSNMEVPLPSFPGEMPVVFFTGKVRPSPNIESVPGAPRHGNPGVSQNNPRFFGGRFRACTSM